MKFGWESEEGRLRRLMRVPPKRKLEWLREMNERARLLPKRYRKIRLKLRASQ